MPAATKRPEFARERNTREVEQAAVFEEQPKQIKMKQVGKFDGQPHTFIVRDPASEADLRKKFGKEFDWARLEGCPDGLPLYRLAGGDCRKLAEGLS